MTLFNVENPYTKASTTMSQASGSYAAMDKARTEELLGKTAGGALLNTAGGASLGASVGAGMTTGSAGGWWGAGIGALVGLGSYLLS